jgi:hypothetical protein
MLLMLDYGIFFEFIPMSDFDGLASKNVIPISEVEEDVNYAIVISTNGGLWRYVLGDTIRFTSKTPFRFKITGRIKSFINTFGEELIVENAERAISKACSKTNAQIRDYTVAPVYMKDKEKGAHEWLIGFEQYPDDIERFKRVLDENLRELNSDYDAKRYNDLILDQPKLNMIHPEVFDLWLKSIGKLGGQHKIPRLMNNRDIVEQILQISQQENYV